MRSYGHAVRGYNAQLVASGEQIIIAAEVTQDANDVEQLAPMLTAARTALTAAGIDEPIRALAADAGYWRAASVNGSISTRPSCSSPWPDTLAAGDRVRTADPARRRPTTSSPPCSSAWIPTPASA